MKILIVEDNEILSRNIEAFLRLKEMEVIAVYSGKSCLQALNEWSFDLLILDIGLPDMDGLAVSRLIRENGNHLPILMLTARNTKSDTLHGFESGADDYLTKPFDYDELAARIYALIRRNYRVKGELITLGDLTVDMDSKKTLLSGQEIHLSSREFALLEHLVRHRWRVVSKEQLFEKVWWEYDPFSTSRTVDVYVGYLRKKLWSDLIETVRGEWYILH